ncbi:metal-dependent hydrolase [Halalkalicoccus tibetensis]|uniref:Metal-dependent hydrolase n=1 Tax=Halalkalicoccus tibetensis TaxID=175632 RepID=A0ABD5UZY2_9EURY
MLPPVHLAVGYLCYAALVRFRGHGAPAERATLAALLGAALPDLIDKPIHWLGVVPVGRTIGHSLLLALPLVALVWVLARRAGERELGVAFAVGILSHIATDVPWHLVSGEYHELGFLLWPVTHMPEYTGTATLGTLAGVEVTTLWIEAVILVCGVALWVADGTPGAGVVKERLGD